VTRWVTSWRDRLRRAPADPGWVPLRRRGPTVRRWLSAGAVAGAVAVGLTVVAPDPPTGALVVAAAREVPAGAALQATDLRLVERPARDLPASSVGDLASLVGRVLAAPLTGGELVTTSRLVGPGLLTGRPPGDVAAPVRLADAQAAELLAPGSRVDVLVAVEDAASARTVARGATVLARPSASGGGGLLDAGAAAGADTGAGGLVLLAVGASTAADLAQAASLGPLSVVVR
jgi:pilus assembly protein CpaB